MSRDWSPFDDDGNLNIVTNDSPWWKRLTGHLFRRPVWHDIGYWIDEEDNS